MKRKISIFVIILFCPCSIELLSQSYVFKVLTSSGKVDYSISSGQSWEKIQTLIRGFRMSDGDIRLTISRVYSETGYLCDPHGACGFEALRTGLKPGQTGIFLETAHPAKFLETIESIIGSGKITIPPTLATFLEGKKQAVALRNSYDNFRDFLLSESDQ